MESVGYARLHAVRRCLHGMRAQELSQGRISRETGLSYNTVKKYFRRIEAEPLSATALNSDLRPKRALEARRNQTSSESGTP